MNAIYHDSPITLLLFGKLQSYLLAGFFLLGFPLSCGFAFLVAAADSIELVAQAPAK